MKLSIQCILFVLVLTLCADNAWALFQGNVPSAAEEIAESLNKQIMRRYARGIDNVENERREAFTRSRFKILGTTPVNLDSLEVSCAAARQLVEEISGFLMEKGYRYQEIRKGRFIRFDRMTGELILTRDVKSLGTCVGCAQAILAGTYVISGKHVRFTISLIHSQTNEILARASTSVRITDDLLPLLDETPVLVPSMRRNGKGFGATPNTLTHLQ